MTLKRIFIDLETTGLSYYKCAITEIGMIVEIPEVEKMNLKTGDALVIRFKRKLRPDERVALRSIDKNLPEQTLIENFPFLLH